MKYAPLFDPLELGSLSLPNRIIMPPLTRMRAGSGGIPSHLNALYYAQRASAGLIIAEGTAVSQQGRGYPNAPGIYTPEQIAGWRQVTQAVHARGGRILLQLAHNGRNSHSSFMPDGGSPVAASAIPPNLPALTSDFRQVKAEIPRALETGEIPAIVEAFRQGAVNAMESGFDGVEIQAANSHLIDQFLEDGSNLRTDQYGGSYENRCRLMFEIVEEVKAEIGPNRLGVRLSPYGQYGGIHDTNPLKLFAFAIKELSRLQIAYLHLIEGRGSELGLSNTLNEDALENARLFRSCFAGPLISAAAYTPETASNLIRQKQADAVAFGRLYIANPDLVERLRRELPLNAYDRSTFYGGSEKGYIDYKTLPQQ